MGPPVDAAHDRAYAVDDQQLYVVDRQPLNWERHHSDASLLYLSPGRPAAAFRRIVDRGDDHPAVAGIEQQGGEVDPLELVELEVDRAPRLVELVGDRRKGGLPVWKRNQLIGSGDDWGGGARRDGNGGQRRGGGTARRTGGGQQRQEEEGQPEAAGRAIHAGIPLYICVYVKGNRRAGRCGIWGYNSAASSLMKTFLGIVELTLALVVMLGVLLQTPKASGLGGTIGGGGDSGGGYRTKRGLEKNLFYATIGLVVLFVVVSVVYVRTA
jgi:preprotein translocase subunit SecG